MNVSPARKALLARVAENYGTPAYAYFQDDMEARIRSLNEHFDGRFRNGLEPGIEAGIDLFDHRGVIRQDLVAPLAAVGIVEPFLLGHFVDRRGEAAGAISCRSLG